MIVCLGGAIMQGLLLFVCAAHSVIYFDVHDDCLGRAVFSVQVNVIAGSTSNLAAGLYQVIVFYACRETQRKRLANTHAYK